MAGEQRDVFYYSTVINQNYARADLPEGVEEDIVRGGYRYAGYQAKTGVAAEGRVTLLGSGAILTEVIKAAQLLAEQGIASDVYSVTSWSELARDGQRCEADGADEARNGDAGQPHITRLLQSSQGPDRKSTRLKSSH